MAQVRRVERRIERIEGLRVRILYEDGRNVRSDRSDLNQYPYERMMKNSSNVRTWKLHRFHVAYQGFDVEVLDARGQKVHGNTLLGTVRDTYLK